jgi:O-antigen ligase
MNKCIAILRTQAILLLFGFIITISLFLGDGKQPVIDVAWACEILLLYAIYYLQNKKLRVLPGAIEITWILLLGYCVVRAVFSDSVGYSLSTVIRLFDAYLVYRLFYSVADEKHTRRLVLGVILIGVVATIASFGCLLFPRFVSWLPPMNLLYASYGHNQLAGIVLFGIPMVVADGANLPSWCKKTAFLLFLSGMIFSFARGAWILLAAYLAFLFVTKRLAGKFYISTAMVFVGAAAGLLVVMSLLEPQLIHEPSTLNNDWFYKQTIKQPVYESRIQYWLQAVSAIQERSMFGSGPGTFYLLSKRFQSDQNSYSWFAHNFVLEQFAEIGLVGVVLWGMLFVAQGRLLIRSRDHTLLAGVLLTFLYSLFEYNLNFLVIWLLFWAVTGWLTGSMQLKKTSPPRPSFLVIGGIVLLFVFSLLSIAGMIETAVGKSDVASLLTPFDADVAITSIENYGKTATLIPQAHLSLLLFFHQKNPEVLYDLARVSPANIAPSFYEQAIIYDPQNTQYMSGLIEHLLEEKNTIAIGALIKNLGESVLPEESKSVVRQIPFMSPIMTPYYTNSLFRDVGQPQTVKEYLAKTYYFLGFLLLNLDPSTTKNLWTLARDSAPEWGYFHVELASLEYHVLDDKEGARNTLIRCAEFIFAAAQCRHTILEDTIVGDSYEYVKAIPALR